MRHYLLSRVAKLLFNAEESKTAFAKYTFDTSWAKTENDKFLQI